MNHRVPRLLLAVGAALSVLAPALSACSDAADSDVSTPASAAPVIVDQARAALITASDLGDPWVLASSSNPSDDGLLGGTTSQAECQNLLTGLKTGNVLDQTPRTKADTRFRAGQSELDYRVASYTQRAAEDGVALLKQLPQTCDRFTSTLSGGARATVEVVALSLPDVGDEHAGLTVTISTSEQGLPATYTADIAAVRMGPNAISLTNGGLDGADHDTTEQAVESGAQRLSQVLEGKTPPGLPSEIE